MIRDSDWTKKPGKRGGERKTRSHNLSKKEGPGPPWGGKRTSSQPSQSEPFALKKWEKWRGRGTKKVSPNEGGKNNIRKKLLRKIREDRKTKLSGNLTMEEGGVL